MLIKSTGQYVVSGIRVPYCQGMTDTLADLTNRLTALHTADPLRRYREARDLALLLKSALAAEQDAAVADACETATYEQVAEQFEVSASEINRRVTAHRKRVGAPARRGRKPRTT